MYEVLEELALPTGVMTVPVRELELSDAAVCLEVIRPRSVVASCQRRASKALAGFEQMRKREPDCSGMYEVVDAAELRTSIEGGSK